MGVRRRSSVLCEVEAVPLSWIDNKLGGTAKLLRHFNEPLPLL